MLATAELLDGSRTLAGGLKVGDEESNKIVPVVNRLLREVPEPRSHGFFEMQLDELHGGITGAVMKLYCRQIPITRSARR